MNAKGIDVSRWQANIDWKLVDPSIDFAFIKCSDGVSGKDPKFAYNWEESARYGIYRGAYHYVRGSEAKKQVDNLLQALNNNYGELPIALDAEDRFGDVLGVTLSMIKELKLRLPNQKVIVYTSPGFGMWPAPMPVDLWVAHWTSMPKPIIPHGWTEYKFWQTGVGGYNSLPGIKTKIDMDEFNGTIDDLKAYSSGIPIPPTSKTQAKCIVYSLKIRSKPSVRGAVLGGLHNGDIFEVEKEIITPGSEVWVKFKGEEKYCALLYSGITMCMYI